MVNVREADRARLEMARHGTSFKVMDCWMDDVDPVMVMVVTPLDVEMTALAAMLTSELKPGSVAVSWKDPDS